MMKTIQTRMQSNFLTVENRLSLSGRVISHPRFNTSPSGIEHCRFIIEHRSQQTEAQLNRQAWCKMPISVSEQLLITTTHSIKVGSKILVDGFITNHVGKNGLSQVVLHAKNIELLELGE